MIGKTLGHYQITNPLGKGGMGEVYRANDQILGRDVAIKVLPDVFAKDADRVARFQREAKVLASLNHPNIAAIYGLEEYDRTNFLVMELVEGQTLADRIKNGPIPIEEALKLGLQIADALEAAHEKGVIHRDLKPANIKVTPDGKVKVLDFGLAKAFAGEQAELNLSNSPTLSDMATQQGVILGTAAYMSPEQAKGKSVDKRADIWAFGAVLFEMLTGKPAFSGEEVSEILASVIKGDASLSLLPANLHLRVRETITRCLQKDLRRRYSSITDARYEIEQALADSGGALMQPIVNAEHAKKQRTAMPWIAAAVILTAIVTGVAIWKLKSPEPFQVIRFERYLAEGQQFGNSSTSFALAVSPNGREFVYSTPKGLYLGSADELTARLIAGTETNPTSPVFSPDGRWIAYSSLSDKKLKKISVNGGEPVPLCDVATAGASWGSDNTVVYNRLGDDIMRISADGGTPKSLVEANSRILYFPQILPDGKSVLYSAILGGAGRTMVQSLRSGDSKELFAGDCALYVPTGHIVFMSNNNLFAVPFDLKKLEIKGDAVPLVEGLKEYAVSDSGTLVYIPGVAAAIANQRTLVWVDRKGKETPITAAPDDYMNPKISPDGKRLAITKGTGNKTDIWILDLARDNMTRLTFNESSYIPLWTLDGKRIVFQSGEKGNLGVVWKAGNGTGTDEKLSSTPGAVLHPSSWSSDGKTLVMTVWGFGAPVFHIGVLPMEGDRKYRPLLKENYLQAAPQISPDGRWMAYVSDESGKMEIYVRPFPEVDKGEKWPVSVAGGESPLWSRDGRELFYRNGDSVIAVAVQMEPVFKPGKPEVLFQGKYVPTRTENRPMWDVHPDGKRFLMMKESASADRSGLSPDSRKFVIVLNWFEELKRRVPRK